MTIDEVIAVLREKTAKRGQMAAFAKAHGVSIQYVSAIVRGSRKPDLPIILALGFRRVVSYEPIKSEARP
jgi:transcriptional regulator with XRE-family HTH domain